MASRKIPRIVIASAMSGGGKTTAACAVMRAFMKKGVVPAPFKCGPDYIDPLHHFAACGRQGTNLDLFFSGQERLKELFARNTDGCGIAVIEGVMGYYDGLGMGSAEASTYETAAVLKAPAALIVPARGMAYTAAALIKGLAEFRSGSDIAAVILNGVTEGTYKMLAPVIERETGIKAAGYIPKLPHAVPPRHLGLELPWEADAEALEKNADIIAETVDTELLYKIASEAPELEYEPYDIKSGGAVRIAAARDRAFCFYYKENFDILKRLGAQIEYFSPLSDKRLPEGVSGVILGGGYPELHARELSENTELLADIKSRLEAGMPCIAECGGFMYLHESMEDENGVKRGMAGVIKACAVKKDRLVRFGYADIKAASDGAYLRAGEAVKAHEFHYWDSTDNGADCIAEKRNGKRSCSCVHMRGTMFAGFPHLYFGSDIKFAERFLDECRRYGR